MKLKPFNLEAAKAGAKVVTRDGRLVRIICTDYKNDNYPVVALLSDGGEESVATYTIDGINSIGCQMDCFDLFMAPTNRRGWVNLRRISNGVCADYKVFPTKWDAETAGVTYDDYVATVPVDWEE